MSDYVDKLLWRKRFEFDESLVRARYLKAKGDAYVRAIKRIEAHSFTVDTPFVQVASAEKPNEIGSCKDLMNKLKEAGFIPVFYTATGSGDGCILNVFIKK